MSEGARSVEAPAAPDGQDGLVASVAPDATPRESNATGDCGEVQAQPVQPDDHTSLELSASWPTSLDDCGDVEDVDSGLDRESVLYCAGPHGEKYPVRIQLVTPSDEGEIEAVAFNRTALDGSLMEHFPSNLCCNSCLHVWLVLQQAVLIQELL